MALTWTTPAGLLFTTTIGIVVNESVSANDAVEYSVISGNLPDGLLLSSNGDITGTISYVENTTTSTFVVRAENTSSLRDRTFLISVIKENIVDWNSDQFNIVDSTLEKLLINKDFVEIQLDANIDHPVTYYIDRNTGKLPFGMNMNSSGKIYGMQIGRAHV